MLHVISISLAAAAPRDWSTFTFEDFCGVFLEDCIGGNIGEMEYDLERMRGAGYRLGNLDATVVAQAPRLAPHQAAMRERIAQLLGAEQTAVNVKLKSADRLGAIGREEGIAAHAVVLLVEDEGDAAA